MEEKNEGRRYAGGKEGAREDGEREKNDRERERGRGEERLHRGTRLMYYLTWTETRTVYCCARPERPAIFTVSVAAVLPSVKHPIITELDMNFCEYAPSVMIHALFGLGVLHVYILREGQGRETPGRSERRGLYRRWYTATERTYR